MNTTTAAVVALGLIVLAFIVFFLVFRSKGKGKIKGPFGVGMEVEGSNQQAPDPAVVVQDATSRKGGLAAEDKTGRGAAVQRVEVEGDIRVSSTPSGEKPPPKT